MKHSLDKWVTSPGSLTVHMSGLPCRQCEKCLKVRAAQWRSRASTECNTWSRTWLCTYTLRPEEHHRVLMRELAEKNRKGWSDRDFSEAGGEVRLRAIGVGRLFTDYLKRVRKGVSDTPTRLRYMVVIEHHKSGLPHLHALVHEVAGPLTYRNIVEHWPHGHANAKLVDAKGAAYVTKYVSKSMLARARASLHYGEPSRLAGIANR